MFLKGIKSLHPICHINVDTRNKFRKKKSINYKKKFREGGEMKVFIDPCIAV